MAAIRVFLLTCRRPALLRRALDSLRAQTFSDWVCELHNDAPEDDSPRRLLEENPDPRITLCQHGRNWGAVAVFNHAYAGGTEPFLAILEDDNWWDPGFLAAAHAALHAHPEANVVWSNLRVWTENPDHTWTDTGRAVWETARGDERPRLFRWPVPLQCFDALHSHGAMLCRAEASRGALVPADTPLDIIEPVRERLLPGAWLLLPQPLAHFAVTLGTARVIDRARWARSQLLVAASYLHAVKPGRAERAALCAALRDQQPPATSLVFHLAFSDLRFASLIAHTRPADWLRFFRGAVRRPAVFLRSLRYRSAQPALWATILAAAHDRTRETPRSAAPAAPLLRKRL